MVSYASVYTILSYLTEMLQSIPTFFKVCFSKLTINFGLVPPLVEALAFRRIIRLLAGTTAGHLHDEPVALPPRRPGVIRRLQQALRIADDFIA